MKLVLDTNVDSFFIIPVNYRDKLPKEPDKHKAPLVDVDSSLPPGYPSARRSLRYASVSPGLIDQVALKD